MKWGALLVALMVLPFSQAFLASNVDPLTVGFDYYIANPYSTAWVVGLYDNTQIYIDTNLDGIETLTTTIHRRQTYSVSASNPI